MLPLLGLTMVKMPASLLRGVHPIIPRRTPAASEPREEKGERQSRVKVYAQSQGAASRSRSPDKQSFRPRRPLALVLRSLFSIFRFRASGCHPSWSQTRDGLLALEPLSTHGKKYDQLRPQTRETSSSPYSVRWFSLVRGMAFLVCLLLLKRS